MLAPDDPARARLYGPLHHNCSGNHAGFLALALLHGVPAARYLDAASPSQARAHRVVEALAGERPDVIEDDCGAPCYDLPLAAVARCYRLLARPDAVHGLEPARRELLREVAELPAIAAALERIAVAMTCFPECVSGEHTGLWRLAREFPGQLVVKNGAEGMLCVAWRDRGAALALKVTDGNPRAALPALLFLMQEFGWLTAEAAGSLREQSEPVRRGTRGQEVGRLRVCRALESGSPERRRQVT
jgi:L-asparaginase II